MTAVPQPARAGSELVARPAGVARSGRDRRHQSPRRRRNITAAFTDAEYAALAAAARRVGLTPTGFCAQAALAAAVAPTQTTTVPSLGADPRVEALAQAQVELATLRTAVVRVGTNLNQAVAALHATGRGAGVAAACGRAVRPRPGARSTTRRRGCIGDCRDPEHHPRSTGAGPADLPVGSGQTGGAHRPAPGRRVGRRRRAGRPRTRPHRAGRHDVRRLAELLEIPVRAGRNPPRKPVWHCSVRTHPNDPIMTDQQWRDIARQVVAKVGLAPDGDEKAVRWIAMRHGADHIHIVATLVRQDRRTYWARNDYPLAQAACRDIEAQLRPGPGRAARTGQPVLAEGRRAEQDRPPASPGHAPR